jgi:Spy/CpxP family protein refolding chaperone
MKRLIFTKLIFISAIICYSFSIVLAQPDPPPPGSQFAENRPPNLLQQLNLTKDQIQQLRVVNREWQPRLQKSQREFKAAQIDLDEAIYLDETSDEIINAKIEVVNATHSEMIRTRTMLQTLIRKILTKEQMERFRQLREDFQQRPQDKPNLRPNQLKRPLQQRRGGRPPI